MRSGDERNHSESSALYKKITRLREKTAMGKGILIKYGEIAIKGNNRAQFENILIHNVRNALYPYGKPWIDKEQGRLFVRQPDDAGDEWITQATAALQTVFGIIGISPVDVLEDESFEAIAQAAVAYAEREYDGASSCHTFKVESKRANKNYPMTSMELSSAIGAKVLDACPNWKVDVHHPELILWVEIRKSGASVIRRHRQPGRRLDDGQARPGIVRSLFSCASLYFGTGQG
jgi:thiamine biosynthesis protein ThiI